MYRHIFFRALSFTILIVQTSKQMLYWFGIIAVWHLITLDLFQFDSIETHQWQLRRMLHSFVNSNSMLKAHTHTHTQAHIFTKPIACWTFIWFKTILKVKWPKFVLPTILYQMLNLFFRFNYLHVIESSTICSHWSASIHHRRIILRGFQLLCVSFVVFFSTWAINTHTHTEIYICFQAYRAIFQLFSIDNVIKSSK